MIHIWKFLLKIWLGVEESSFGKLSTKIGCSIEKPDSESKNHSKNINQTWIFDWRSWFERQKISFDLQLKARSETKCRVCDFDRNFWFRVESSIDKFDLESKARLKILIHSWTVESSFGNNSLRVESLIRKFDSEPDD